MADQRITQLTPLLEAEVAATDVLPVVDVSASETKKVTAKDLFEAGATLADAGSIDLAKLDQASTTKLGSDALADGAVTAAKLAPDSTIAVEATAPTADNFEGRGFFDSDNGNLQVYNGTAYQQVVMPTAGIADASITTDKLAAGAVTTDKVSPLGTAAYADASITTGKLADGAVTAAKIATDSITAAQISPGAVGTDELATDAVTYDKLQPASSGDVLLGRNSSLPGDVEEVPCSQAGRDLLQALTVASQRDVLGLGTLATANGTWADGSSFSGTSSGTNTGDQTITLSGAVTGTGTGAIVTTLSAGVITDTNLADGSVTAAKLAAGAVTAAKLAGNSSTVISTDTPTGAGAFVGQLHINDNTGDTYYFDGTGWEQVAGFTSLTFVESGPLGFAVTLPAGRNAPQIDVTLDTQQPNTVWAGPSSGSVGAAPTFRALVGADLPAPDGVSKGGVYAGEGTVIDHDGELRLAPAGSTTLGGVRVDGTVLSVDSSGLLAHVASPLAAGSYAKIVTDAKGHVIASEPLLQSDIPELDASKITTGSLDPARIAGKSVVRTSLADYAIAYIQEENPGIVTDHNGCLWLQESTGQLRMWNGNSWYPVGFGRLAQENLRWAGLIDASTGLILLLTEAGVASGLIVGAPLPVASAGLGGVYLAVNTAGGSIGVTPGITYDVGDWVLCVDQIQGWVRIDTAAGGGGGGAQTLDQLLDVTLTSPAQGQTLTYNATLAQWVNAAPATAPVQTVFGRAGAVVAAEGDYTLNLLGDVDLTTTPPNSGNALVFDGTQWKPASPSTFSVTTTQGDLIQRGATQDQRLPIGVANTVLHVNASGTLAEWRALAAASTTVSGVTRYATNAETVTGTAANLAVTPAGAKAAYLPLNIDALPLLP